MRQVSVDLLVDVRSVPRSRTNPQFNADAIAAPLAAAGIGYRHLKALGGLRHRPKDAPPSPNTLWRNPAFRNFADYAQTQAFRSGLDELLALAAERPTAFLCAETHWSRCHRRILADKLWALGHEVIHLIDPTRAEPHRPTPFLRVDGAHLRYDLPVG